MQTINTSGSILDATTLQYLELKVFYALFSVSTVEKYFHNIVT